MIAVAAVVPEEARGPVVGGDDDVEISVAVVVGIGGPAADHGHLEGGAQPVVFGLEALVAGVAEQVRRLRVAHARLHGLDVVGHVPVGGEDVEPAVEVVVEEERREAEAQEGGLADGRGGRVVDEEPRPFVVVERHHLVREVAHHDAGAARAVVVGGIGPHSGAGHAGLAEGHARGHAHVREGPLAPVAVQLVGLGVVGDEEVRPAVVVVVEHGHAQRLGVGVAQPRLDRDVLEGAVPAVAVQDRALPLVRLRRAVGLVGAVQRAEEVLVQRPLHVVGDEQVQLAVLVVVEEGRAGAEASAAGPGLRGDVGEAAVALVVEEPVAAEAGEVDVHPAVVVVVGGRAAQPVHRDVEAGPAREVRERAVTVVAIERGQRSGTGPPRPVLRVDEEEVGPAVPVEVHEQHARAHRLRQVLLPKRARVVLEADPGGGGCIAERHGGGGGRGGRRGPHRGLEGPGQGQRTHCEQGQRGETRPPHRPAPL